MNVVDITGLIIAIGGSGLVIIDLVIVRDSRLIAYFNKNKLNRSYFESRLGSDDQSYYGNDNYTHGFCFSKEVKLIKGYVSKAHWNDIKKQIQLMCENYSRRSVLYMRNRDCMTTEQRAECFNALDRSITDLRIYIQDIEKEYCVVDKSIIEAITNKTLEEPRFDDKNRQECEELKKMIYGKV